MAIAVVTDGGRLGRVTFRFIRTAETFVQDLNQPALYAGVNTFIWYTVALLPVQVALISRFGLAPEQVSSWLCAIWASGSVASIALSLMYRQPLPIASSLPALLFLSTLADRFTFAELMSANLMAGIAIVVLAFLGLGSRVLTWLPLPIAMGMFAGSILGDVTRMIQATSADGIVAIATLAGYLLGRLKRRPVVPPIAAALIAGAVASLMTGEVGSGPIDWRAPVLITPQLAFAPSAFVAVSIPLIVLSLGLGHVQGLGYLMSLGYAVPVRSMTWGLGMTTVVNALFGGHIACVSRNAVPMVAGPEAGRVQGRYWAVLIAAGLCLSIAVAAGPAASVVAHLPSSYIVVLTGLAILPSLQHGLECAFGGKLRFGAMVALAVAATPLTFLGVTSGFWALPAGLAASFIVERNELIESWRQAAPARVHQ